ncbi:hypothetical protein [Mucilaginibacter jinjuensis]|uniref:Lipoprotein n=1 Tax=Mucilaginibacter jinjuensis TaxID=1176721 RepID=A0ABY7T922_9SPHI|nr:hypothetical protein [Mucilaginibacter jinjuensis]WCT12980.1 hypothetical protein PQO05_03405 [Mucilaginibacter jinjuensis]
MKKILFGLALLFAMSASLSSCVVNRDHGRDHHYPHDDHHDDHHDGHYDDRYH